jgi:hypothetical protein
LILIEIILLKKMDVLSDILLSEAVNAPFSDAPFSDESISEVVEALLSDCNLKSETLGENAIKDDNMDSEAVEATKIVKRMPRGRPRQFEYKTKQDYHKAYYILHKHKWNMDYQCPSCELVCSYVNKGRHEKSSYHLRIVEQKKAMSTTTTTQ